MTAPVHIAQALAWVDAATPRLETEEVALRDASERVLAEDIRAAAPIPPHDRAALDGFAVSASDSISAGIYSPLSLPTIAVAAGDAMPEGMDTVVPLDRGLLEGDDRVLLVEAVAAGDGVERQGTAADAGDLLAAAWTRLAPRHIGLLAVAGLTRAPVARRPRVRITIAGSVRSGDAGDSDGPMLRAAVTRDGGIIAETVLADAFAAGADIILVVGGTGPGRADVAAAALAAAGEVAIHGIALRPGETAGFGRIAAGTPVLLLPGAPHACLWTYELFAGRAIRRLAGRDPCLPYRKIEMTTARKIVSAIGMAEIWAVHYRPDGLVEPIASLAEIGLPAAAEAAGFVIVPEASEGYPPGTAVTVYLYDDR